MARIRSIKPTFFRSRSVKALSSDEKLVWIGLWSAADDEGRLLDEVGILVGDLWALSLSASKLDGILARLDAVNRIQRYEIAGQRYIQVCNWQEHQRISHPTVSDIPPAPLRTVSGIVPDPLRREGKGRDRRGGEAPPLFCPNHPSGTDGPCRPCGDARRAHEAWLLAEKTKPSPSIRAPKLGDGHDHHDDGNGFCPLCGERA